MPAIASVALSLLLRMPSVHFGRMVECILVPRANTDLKIIQTVDQNIVGSGNEDGLYGSSFKGTRAS